MTKVEISASILAADFTRLGAHMKEAEAAGVERFHVDVMDGRFVPNITFGPLILEAARQCTKATIEAHLMIVDPERYIPEFAKVERQVHKSAAVIAVLAHNIVDFGLETAGVLLPFCALLGTIFGRQVATAFSPDAGSVPPRPA